ncbi:YadA family autotransporter adhesin, partial [Alcaligenes endophyticus]
VSSVVNDGWSISVNGEKDIAVKPGKSIDFKSQDDNIAIALSDTGMAFKLAQQLNIGQSITIGKDGPSITADGINMGGKTITNLAKGSQDNDAVTMAQLNEVSSVVNDGWSISVNGEKDIAVKPGKLIDFKSQDDNIAIALSDTGMAFQLAQQLNIGQSITIGKDGPSITAAGINMSEKTITNLAKGSQDGDAVNMAQFKEISKTANYGWSISANGKASTNVNSGTSVDFSSKGDNISITPNANGLAFELSKDLNLGQDGSLTVGNTALNNEGLTVQDSASNKTSTTAWGTTVSNAAGDKTSVGAGSITVADAKGNTTSIGSTLLTVGGAHPVNINGETGRIGGLSNKTWNPDDYTSGQAATEDQLKHVSDIARSGWTATDSGDNSSTIGPKGIITFVGDDNIALEQTGTDNKAKIEVKLNKDLDLGTDGSVKTAGTLINSAGLTVGENVQLGSIGLIITNGPSMTTAGIHAGGMRISQVAAGISATDAVNYGQLQPLESFIPLDGKGSFAYNGGQHSTLKEVLDSLHWNVEAPAEGGSGGSNGSGLPGGGNSSSGQNSSIHNGNAVGFVQGDNIVISKTDKVNDAGQVVGADIKVAVAQDIKVNAVKANEIQINNGGPIINEQGIDMSGKRIANVAAGVNETDAVNVRQLQEATGGLQNQVSHIRQDVHRLDNRLSAGVAAAMATASLPQAYLPGKNMMSMAGGTWRGESGMAIGFSGITENGRWIYKLSGNSTSRGDYGGAVGVGYQW